MPSAALVAMVAFLALAAGALGVTTYGLLALYRRSLSMRQARMHEVIEVFDSPLPTRSAKLLSSETRRRMNEPMRAMRKGGARRYPCHRRSVTLMVNPSLPDHCGCVCLLSIAGIKPSLKNVMELRCKTAMLVEQAYLK